MAMKWTRVATGKGYVAVDPAGHRWTIAGPLFGKSLYRVRCDGRLVSSHSTLKTAKASARPLDK